MSISLCFAGLLHAAAFCQSEQVVSSQSSAEPTRGPAEPTQRAEELKLLGTVYAHSARCMAYAGPSEDFYPTSLIKVGTSLDVYHHTADGWLGVRPPEGSFSWVPAKDAYLLPGGKTIEITNPASISWIGTSLGAAKQFRWQIQLSPGNQLTVLGEARMKDDQEKEVLWYRIAPPAGEFRWVRESDVSENAPAIQPTIAGNRQPEAGQAAAASTVGSNAATASGTPKGGASEVVSASASILEDAVPAGSRSDPSAKHGREKQPVESQRNETQRNRVQTAQYSESSSAPSILQDDVFEDSLPAPQGSQYYDGPPVGTESFHEQPQYAEVAGPPVHHSAPNTILADPFDGWYAFDFTDSGVRSPLLERLFGGKASNRGSLDHLSHDPYSLNMANKMHAPHSVRDEVAADIAHYRSQAAAMEQYPPPGAGHRPWRDPRELRRRRSSGLPTSIARRDDYTDSDGNFDRQKALEEARQKIDSIANTLRDTLGVSTGGARPNHIPSAQLQTPQPLSDLPNSPAKPSDDIQWYGIDKNNNASTGPLQIGNAGLNQLQVNLSEIVTRPMSSWNLAPLAAEAQRYIASAPSAIERGQARLLLDRIREFEELAGRSSVAFRGPAVTGISYQAPESNPASTTPLAFGPHSSTVGSSTFNTAGYRNAAQPSSGADNSAAPGQAAHFDASGWLVPVHSTVPGQPTHALTDDNGRIVAYVTPIPGMNLATYVNQPVGIKGLRGYMPNLKAGHIQAQQISILR